MIGIILFLGTVEAAIQLFNSTTNTSILSGLPIQNGVSFQTPGGLLGVEGLKLIGIESTTSSNDGEASTSLAPLPVVTPPYTPPTPLASALGSTTQSLNRTLTTSAPLETTIASQEGFSLINVPGLLQPTYGATLEILSSVRGGLGDVPPRLPTLSSTTEIWSKTTDIAASEVAPNYAPSYIPVTSTDSPISIAASAISDHGGSRIAADTISEITLGTQTLSAGHQATVSGIALSLDPSGSILVINHTQSRALAYTTQPYTKTVSQGGALTTITGTGIFLAPPLAPGSAYQTSQQEPEISQPNAGTQTTEPKLGDAILGLGGFTASATRESASLTTSHVPHEGGRRKDGSRNNTESVEYLGTGSTLETAVASPFNVLFLSSVLTTLLYL